MERHSGREAQLRDRKRRLGRSDGVQYQGQRLPSGSGGGLRESYRVDQVDRHDKDYDKIDVSEVQHDR
jgi:hypothetical protein